MKSIEQCLDIILRELLKNWNKPNNERDNLDPKELLRQFELPDTMQKDEFFKRLIFRLVNDGYAEFNTNLTMDRNSHLEQFQNYPLITIEGYYFITKDNGGYEAELAAKNQRETNRLRTDNRMETATSDLAKWTERLFWGTVVVGIGACGLVIWEIVAHFLNNSCH